MFAAGAALLAALVAWLNVRGEEALVDGAAPPRIADAATLQRGAYLARAGNCIGCHTARGGADYAGGRGIATPFGTVFAPNLTPDDATGLGRWTEAEFWRAMHHGRSKDGRLLYPAFPYPSFTQIARADSAALYAWLRSLPPVHRPNRAHELRFAYSSQAALAVWRALYFRPGTFEPDARESAEWNRGAYLVRGLGHCAACHAERDALGASRAELRLAGGLIPVQNWYAPPLALADGDAAAADFVALLKHGVMDRGTAMGPMAEVVTRSTAFLDDADLRAMARYLVTLPAPVPPRPRAEAMTPAARAALELGRRIYADRCVDCHGKRGEGSGQGQGLLYPPLAGNPTVMQAPPHNVVKAILHGGFAPTTPGNPRPAGMPPFAPSLSEAEIAAVASFVRQSWGNRAPAVSPLDVLRVR